MYSNNGKVKLPTNIKQIGNISDGIRIYVEDYAYTYIQQYAKEVNNEERIAVLVGENYIIDGKEVLFVSGMIQGKHSEVHNSMRILTDKSWDYIDESMNKYFPELKIVGWVYIQPGFGDYINDSQLNYHSTFFTDSHQVLFVYDPIEKVSNFFSWSKALEEEFHLEVRNGYIIYYDKNENMQAYMIENRDISSSCEEENIFSKKLEERKEQNLERMALSSESKPRTNRIRGKILHEQRKMVNLFGSLSAILFLVCFIMGAGLVQNDDRISKLEAKLNTMDNSYQYLLSQIKDDNVQSVFAAQSQSTMPQVIEDKQTSATEALQIKTEPETQAALQESAAKTQESAVKEAVVVVTETPSAKIDVVYDKYEIQEGDTLGYISRKVYGNETMMDEIMNINNIENPDKIRIGQKILLPRS